jgi:hypothetical protein
MKPIHIEINDRRKVFTVREVFSSEFPNLKLEFYGKPHTEDGPHSRRLVRNSGTSIGDCRTVDRNGILVIQPGMTVADLKNHLRDTFGLEAEVYRLTGTSWEKPELEELSLEELSRPITPPL